MRSTERGALAALCTLVLVGAWATQAGAQSTEVKEKPPMYTYVSNWTIPRARWADMEKEATADAKVFEKVMSGGGLVGYGDDTNLVHQADGDTHDSFWSGMSMAAVIGVLDELHKAGATASPVLVSATKHWDALYVSRFYSWKSGSVKGAYTHVAQYKLKDSAPDDALQTLCRNLFVPLMEKQLAAGTIVEYEIDTEAIHTETPGTFAIVFIAPSAEGIDKVQGAVRELVKTNALVAPTFDSMVDVTPHHDYLERTNATYK